MQVSAAHEDDKAGWLPLWQAYLDFYDKVLADEITDLTFMRALDPHEPVFLFLAKKGDLYLGFVSLILHRSTWAKTQYVYLEDLFVAPEARGQGVAKALIEQVIEVARHNDCGRVYWVTHEDNKRARSLYDRLADNKGLVTYFART